MIAFLNDKAGFAGEISKLSGNKLGFFRRGMISGNFLKNLPTHFFEKHALPKN